MGTKFRYKAFISYSHKDEAVAEWLHRALENYSVPPHLVGRETKFGTVPKSIRPVFRDQSELAVSASLTDSVTEALSQSEYLIVICSPNAVASSWVQQEILAFKREHGEANVLAVIASGEPFASDLPDSGDEECFPSALRYALSADGTVGTRTLEPLAADIRAGRGGKHLARLKLAAALLRVDLDELVQRDTQRRYQRLRIIAAGAVAGMLVMGWLTFTATQARTEAETQRSAAEDLIEFMLVDLRQKLEPVGRLDAMDSVGDKALSYYEGQDKASLDADSLGRRARALHLIGEIGDIRGDTEGALRTFQEASASTAALLGRDPSNPQRMFDHSQSEFWVGYVAFQRGEYDVAKDAFEQYFNLATDLVGMEPANEAWQLELVYANSNLGTLAFERRRWAEAEAAFLRALSISESLVAANPERPDLRYEVANNYSWLGSIYVNTRRFAEAGEQTGAEIGAFEDILLRDSKNRRAQLGLLIAKRGKAHIAIAAGDLDTVLAELLSAATIAEELINLEPDSTVYQEQFVAVERDKAELYYHVGRLEDARSALQSALAMTSDLIAKDDTVTLWQVDYLTYCQLLLARIDFDEHRFDEVQATVDAVLSRLADIADSGSTIRQLPRVTGTAHLLAGNLFDYRGASAAATLSWERAQLALQGPSDTLDPGQLTVLIAALARLGRESEAFTIIDSLDASGYRHPAYMSIRNQMR
jgi:tetratricopeptide (TPR) repeat protein